MIIREPKLPVTTYDDDRNTEWSYTTNLGEVEKLRKEREHQRGVKERPTISRDSPISGGVYEGAYGGEAIVVDTEKYSRVSKAVEDILEKVTVGGAGDKRLILDTVYEYVFEHMRYDSEAVDKIFTEDCRGVDGQKISLDTYIADGVGECRHQALFAGAILEQLAERGVVHGKASVERNLIKSGADGKYDGHSWLRYTNSAGKVYIIDIAQQRLDTLDHLMQKRRNGEKIWDYGRKEDHDKIRGALAVEVATTIDLSNVARTDLQQPVIIDKIPDWVMNPDTSGAEAGKTVEIDTHTQLLQATKNALLSIADHMQTGTVDGYVLSYMLDDESRKLQAVDKDLSAALSSAARDAVRQASSRYGSTAELAARLHQLAAAI